MIPSRQTAKKFKIKFNKRKENRMNQTTGNDLTKGSIWQHLITFSTPLLLGNVFQALYNTVDSIWVGRFLGAKALGAVSVSFPIIFVLVSLVMGITMATTVLVAQYAGAKDLKMVSKTINNSFLLLGTAAITVSVLGLMLSKRILMWMNTPEDIIGYANDYLNIFLAGLIFMFGYNVVSSILRGLGDSRTPLRFLIIATITNIILDPIFIFGIGFVPKMGIQGAALATILSQAFSFVLALRFLNSRNHIVSVKFKEFKFDKELTSKTIKIGLPAGVQQVIVSFGMIVMTGIINSFGTETVAAFGATSRFDQFAHMPAMSMGLAVSAMAGQNIGAGKNERVKGVYKCGSILTVAISAVITLLVMTAPKLILQIFTTEAHVLEIGSRYLRIVGLSYIPFALMFVTNGILRGAGDTIPTMVFSIVSLWLIRVPLARYLSSLGTLGVDGVWIAICVSSIISMLASQIYFATGRWKKNVIIKRSAQ
jgi:putative MATE family efflux protein